MLPRAAARGTTLLTPSLTEIAAAPWGRRDGGLPDDDATQKMLLSRAFAHLAQCYVSVQVAVTGGQQRLSPSISRDFSISSRWSALGPFQIGTRESPWSSDALEFYGGFHSLKYDQDVSFRSSLAFNGTVHWQNITAAVRLPSSSSVEAQLVVNFLPSIDWPFLQDVYGWAGHQWLGWARSEVHVHSRSTKTLALNTRNILEFWVDDTRYFGGDFYGFGRAAVTLHLSPGVHRIDVKLVGDVRAIGGLGEPTVDVQVKLHETTEDLSLLYYGNEDVLMSDIVGGADGTLASPYVTVAVRNDAQRDVYVHGIEGMQNVCTKELLVRAPIKVAPGQTRPIGFRLSCTSSFGERLLLGLNYTIDGKSQARSLPFSTRPDVHGDTSSSHKFTYIHPSGVVSYAILRPPSKNGACGSRAADSVPIMIGLHGAATNAANYDLLHSIDAVHDLCAWLLVPQGTTPWSGDDWHSWGLADVEAAVAAIPAWIEQVGWQGRSADPNRWLVTGHSNGGQGVYYLATHRPDKVIAAAALSGYSSIQNYVPYISWRTADPGQMAIVQASLSSYRHDLLMDNVKGIPMILQHGSKDDNVPAYHSRLMDMRINKTGGSSAYFEIPGKNHDWDGVTTMPHLRDFYREHLSQDSTVGCDAAPHLPNFSMVVADSGDMGPKNGVQVRQLISAGQLGRLDFDFDPTTSSCLASSSNVGEVLIASSLNICKTLSIDDQDLTRYLPSSKDQSFVRTDNEWTARIDEQLPRSGLPQRKGRQLGAMDAILRTKGAFQIVRHSTNTSTIALQVSRNLCQYYAADTQLTSSYGDALASDGNVLSISIGEDYPLGMDDPNSLRVGEDVRVRDGQHRRKYIDRGQGLAAIFLRPLPDERLELVVWGCDKESLEVAARLVPMMTGSGQPDFVILDKSMLWKGVAGSLALGFFDSDWEISKHSYFT